jgi:membrane protease YdiL (CAAX protease family)
VAVEGPGAGEDGAGSGGPVDRPAADGAPHHTGPDGTGPDGTGPDGTGPDGTGPDAQPPTAGPDPAAEPAEHDRPAHPTGEPDLPIPAAEPERAVRPGEPAGRAAIEEAFDRIVGPTAAVGVPAEPATRNGHHPERNGSGPAAGVPWTAPAWEPAAVAAGGPPEQPVPVPAGATAYPATASVPPTVPAPPPPPAPGGAQPSGPPRGRAAAPARTHRWGLGAYLLAEAVFLVSSLVVGALVGVDGAVGAGGLAVALAVPTVLAAGTALLMTRLRGNGPRADLRLTWSWRDVGLGVAFGLGGLVITVPASVLFVAIAGENATSAVGEIFGGTRAPLPLAIVIFLIVVLLAPLCEEILYRGLLWGGVEKLAGPRVAFAVSTLLFALAHFEFTRTPLLLVVAIPIAAARYYTGRLTSSIIAHQINNLLPGVVLALGLIGAMPMG